MSNLVVQSKKIIAAELANLIFTESNDSTTKQKLIEQLKLNLVDEEQQSTSWFRDEQEQSTTVGIWKPEIRNGDTYYVRDSRRNAEWAYWAQIHEIPPKSSKKRVLMLGESVARGYLYDPYYYPAQVLENILEKYGTSDYEIVDLARTNMDLKGLFEFAADSVNLDPDAMVIFAGNNWYNSVRRDLSKNEVKEMASVLEREGTKGLEQFLLGKFKKLIHNLLKRLGKIAAERNIPVLFIIPEFNLVDWRSSANEKILTSLSNDVLRAWHGAKASAEEALSTGDLKAACGYAQQMIDADHSHPWGYEIMAYGKLQTGLYDEARTCLESARDTSIYYRADSKPRTHALVREIFLEEAHNFDIKVIDLPTVFTQQRGGKLPGRDLFLDYCHLSEEGIQIAMAAAAKALLKYTVGKEVALEDFNAWQFKASDEVKAVAYACAAVHNAHYGQTHDVLYYLCEMAVKCSPVAIEIMTSYVDFATRRISSTLCKSHEKLVENEWINQYGGGVGFLHKREQKIMDIALVNAMIKALKTVNIDLSGSVKALRKKEHGVNGRKVNLLESFYNSTSYDIYQGRTPSFYQSRNVESEFFIVADEGKSVNTKLTYRTPQRNAPSDKINMFINGAFFKELSASEQWSTHAITIPAELVVDEINVVKFVWSSTFEFADVPKFRSKIAKDAILDRLYQVYGEIIHFTASAE
ncbi:hypothetical protein [Chryseolinea lacunae]|uniref:SGNH hydrolase-type esterase domain-containing protein n=1 Tax=Chryseolinea lacunae TaxID=2801331 RepID=A0ABS1KUE4_9BACT|nr:hypothetical protein [Chryseolinea lacunae]MBL0743071.1 hypothetical protein [Chryseolinea lacunae]